MVFRGEYIQFQKPGRFDFGQWLIGNWLPICLKKILYEKEGILKKEVFK